MVSSPPSAKKVLPRPFPISRSLKVEPKIMVEPVMVSMPAPPVSWAVVRFRSTVTPAGASE